MKGKGPPPSKHPFNCSVPLLDFPWLLALASGFWLPVVLYTSLLLHAACMSTFDCQYVGMSVEGGPGGEVCESLGPRAAVLYIGGLGSYCISKALQYQSNVNIYKYHTCVAAPQHHTLVPSSCDSPSGIQAPLKGALTGNATKAACRSQLQPFESKREQLSPMPRSLANSQT